MDFYGRTELLQQLHDLWGKRVSSLVTCRGRRRIGKSTLIERFAAKSKARFIKIEGLRPGANTKKEDEMDAFASQLAAQTTAENSRPADWLRAFIRLSKEIRPREKTVVLLDEVSAMTQAYSLRAPGQKGIHISAWGTFLGQLLLRTMDRADDLYEAMMLRGFSGEFHYAAGKRSNRYSWAAALIVCIAIVTARYINIPAFLTSLFI